MLKVFFTKDLFILAMIFILIYKCFKFLCCLICQFLPLQILHKISCFFQSYNEHLIPFRFSFSWLVFFKVWTLNHLHQNSVYWGPDCWVPPRHTASDSLWQSSVLCMLNQHSRSCSCLLTENSSSVVILLRFLLDTTLVCTEATKCDTLEVFPAFLSPSISRVSSNPVDLFFQISTIGTISYHPNAESYYFKYFFTILYLCLLFHFLQQITFPETVSSSSFLCSTVLKWVCSCLPTHGQWLSRPVILNSVQCPVAVAINHHTLCFQKHTFIISL